MTNGFLLMRKQRLRLCGIISCPRQKLRELSRQPEKESKGQPEGLFRQILAGL